MRLYAFALGISTPILAHNTTFTGTSASTMADLNFSAGPRRSDGIHKDVHVNQSLAVRGYKIGEERTRSLNPGPAETKLKMAASKLVAALHKHYPELSELSLRVMRQLKESDGNVIDHFTGLYPDINAKDIAELEQARVLLNRRQQLVQGQKDVGAMIESIRDVIRSRQRKTVKEFEGKLAKWLQEGLHPDEVFNALSIAKTTFRRTLINPLASSDLEVLWRYIEMYNKLFIHAKDEEITLVRTLYRGFGIDLAHYLSVASHSPIFGPEASAMHQDLLMEWYRDRMDMDGAANMLKISTETGKYHWIKNLDTFIKYSALLHEKGRVKGITTFAYLKTRLGDYFFSLLIADARNPHTSFLMDWEDDLFKIWKTEGVTPEDLYTRVIVRPRSEGARRDRIEEEDIPGRFAAWWAENE